MTALPPGLNWSDNERARQIAGVNTAVNSCRGLWGDAQVVRNSRRAGSPGSRPTPKQTEAKLAGEELPEQQHT